MHASALTIETITELALLHLALAIWTGLLAARWKNRSGWRWFGTGLLLPVAGLLLLAARPRMPGRRIETEMELQYLDGTGLLR